MQGSERLRTTDAGLVKLTDNLPKFIEYSGLSRHLLWIHGSSSTSLLSLFNEKKAQYHHNCFSKYNDNKFERLLNSRKRSTKHHDSSSDSSRPKRRSDADPFPIECVFCGKQEKDLRKMSKTQKESKMLHASNELHTTVHNANVKHVKKQTDHWIEMASALGDIRVLYKIGGDLRANEILYHSKCLKRFQYEYVRLNQCINEQSSEISYKKSPRLRKNPRFFDRKI